VDEVALIRDTINDYGPVFIAPLSIEIRRAGVQRKFGGRARRARRPVQTSLADSLFRQIPAGVGSKGAITLDATDMNAMLSGGARWSVERGWGEARDLDRIEEGG
jgi:tRNA-splicing ligase RtcB